MNLKLRRSKCVFGKPEIEFLGYRINGDGIFLDKKRIEAILLMPKPKNSSDIKIWLGTLQMLKKFDSGFDEAASGINKVSHKYAWGPEQEEG